MSKKYKILIVVTTFPSLTETFILNQITDLIDKGHDVTVFAYVKPKNQPIHQIFKDYDLDKIAVTHFKNAESKLRIIKESILFYKKYLFQINHLKILRLLNPFKFDENLKKLKVYFDLPIFLFKKEFDIIHCHFGFNGKKVADACELGLCGNAKTVLSFHGSDLTPSKVNYYKKLYKGVFKHFSALITNSIYLQNILLLVNPNISKNYIIPVGFNVNYLKKHLSEKPKGDVFNIVFCGRLINWKGPDRAIRIFKKLIITGRENCVLHIIGNGEMKAELEALANSLQVANQIVFYGAISQEEVFKVMANSSVFLLPGISEKITERSETQGLVLQEAQFFRLPVVTADVGGIKYGMIPNETGFLVVENTEDSFVEKLILLYDKPELVESMGDKGHDFVAANFESSILGLKFEAIYNSISN